jgi:hypothetical protein
MAKPIRAPVNDNTPARWPTSSGDCLRLAAATAGIDPEVVRRLLAAAEWSDALDAQLRAALKGFKPR